MNGCFFLHDFTGKKICFVMKNDFSKFDLYPFNLKELAWLVP